MTSDKNFNLTAASNILFETFRNKKQVQGFC